MHDETRSAGRFRSTLTLHEALDAAAAVILEACAGDISGAATVSKADYERSRTTLGGLGLSAEGLRQRLGMPWRHVVELALTPAPERGLQWGPFVGRPDAEWETDWATQAIRALTRRSGATSAAAYDAAAQDIARERAARRLPPLNLPSAAAVTERLGGWRAALAMAGVAPSTDQRLRDVRPAVETLDRVISETGLLPGRGQFEKWCRAHDIPLGRDVRGWDSVVAAVRARRTARGEATPASATPAREWPALPEPVTGRLTRRRVKGYTRQEALASLRLMDARHRRPHERLTEKLYRAACARDPELIPSSCLQRHGRFQELVREAGVG